MSKINLIIVPFTEYGKGGGIGFEKLSNKVAKNYEGKKVAPKYQHEYGKTYSKLEAKVVGDKVAGKVYWQQQGRKFGNGGGIEDTHMRISKAIFLAYGNIDETLEFKDYYPTNGVAPYRLVLSAVQRGWITPEEINKDVLNSAYETSSETEDAEEIGSSDMNHYVWSMLRDAGFDMKVENGRYIRVDKMATGGTILDEYEEEEFEKWKEDGNVSKNADGSYSTQDAGFRNRLKNLTELKKYFKKEFFSDSHYANGGSVEDYRTKAIEKQRKEEEGKDFAPYRAFVYEDSYQFADFKTDEFHKAVKWAKETLEAQRTYRKNSDNLWAIVDEFTPIEKRNNVIYAYSEVARFGEENIKDMKYGQGGSMSGGMKTYYIVLADGSKKEFTVNHPKEIAGIYFAMGFNRGADSIEKGLPMVHYNNELAPLFHADGTPVAPVPQLAGKDYFDLKNQMADGGNVDKTYERTFRNNAGKDILVKIIKNPIFGKYDYWVDGSVRGTFDTYAEAYGEIQHENFDMYAKGGGIEDEDFMSQVRTSAREGIDWEEELKNYAGSNYKSLTAKEKEEIIAEMKENFDYHQSYARGGLVVTLIKDIPNFKEELEAGRITYRGLGMGKLSKDFYNIAGEGGTQIKVKGKEYFITDTEFNTFSRDKDGYMKVRFDAPRRRFATGGNFDSEFYAVGGNVQKIEDIFPEEKLLPLLKNTKFKTFDSSEIQKIEYENQTYNPFDKGFVGTIHAYPCIITIDKKENGNYEVRLAKDTGWIGGITYGGWDYVFEIPKLSFEEFEKGLKRAVADKNIVLYSVWSSGGTDKFYFKGTLEEAKKFAKAHGYTPKYEGDWDFDKQRFVNTKPLKIRSFFNESLPNWKNEKTLRIGTFTDSQIARGGVQRGTEGIQKLETVIEKKSKGGNFDSEFYAEGGNISKKNISQIEAEKISNEFNFNLDEYSFQEIIFSTRKSGNISLEKYGKKDIVDAEKFAEYISKNYRIKKIKIESVDEFVLVIVEQLVPYKPSELQEPFRLYSKYELPYIIKDFIRKKAPESIFYKNNRISQPYVELTKPFDDWASEGRTFATYDVRWRIGEDNLRKSYKSSSIQPKLSDFYEKIKIYLEKNIKNTLPDGFEKYEIEIKDINAGNESIEDAEIKIFIAFYTYGYSKENDSINTLSKESRENREKFYGSKIYAKGGGIEKGNYAYVEAETTTGEKVFKFFEEVPTHKEVYAYFRSVKDENGNPITLKDTTIHVEEVTDFDRDLFLEKANEIAISTFGSPIKELDDLMFSFDKNNLSVFKFEAELENGMEVSIQTVDGVVVIEAEDEEKFKGGGSVKTLPTFDNIPKDKSWAKWVAQHKDGEWWYYDASPRLVENVGWKNSDRDGFQMPSGITTDSKGWDSRAYLLDKATGKIMKQGGNLDLANDTYYVKNENIKLVKYKNGKEVYNWEYWYGTDADNKDEVFSGLVVAKSPITDPNQYSMFKAGGKLPEDAMYIKRSDINSVIIYDEKTGNEVEIPSNKIVSGIWFDNTRTQILIDKAKKEGLLSENKKKNKK